MKPAFCVLVLAACAVATQPPAPITVIPGKFVRGTQPDGNSELLRGRDGIIVVDTGRQSVQVLARGLLEQLGTRWKASA